MSKKITKDVAMVNSVFLIQPMLGLERVKKNTIIAPIAKLIAPVITKKISHLKFKVFVL